MILVHPSDGETAYTPAVFRRDPTERFRRQVRDRGSFENDWFTRHIRAWEPLMRTLEGQRATILELGSFEGLSTSYMLWRIGDARVTAVDTWTYQGEIDPEARFDANVALVDSNRVEKIKGATAEVLPALIAGGRRFHFIYVDASHDALDVIVDAALAWRLLRPGGLMVFDDYGWQVDDPQRRPTEAVDAFMRLVADLAVPVPCGNQAAFRRVR